MLYKGKNWLGQQAPQVASKHFLKKLLYKINKNKLKIPSNELQCFLNIRRYSTFSYPNNFFVAFSSFYLYHPLPCQPHDDQGSKFRTLSSDVVLSTVISMSMTAKSPL